MRNYIPNLKRASGSDGGAALDCKPNTLETPGVRISPSPPFLGVHKNSKKQGDAGLGVAIGYFSLNSYTVLVPLTDSQDYDLVVEDNKNILYRVQVKTVTFIDRGVYSVGLSVKGGNRSGIGKIKKFVGSNVDLLFILTATGEQYLIPTDVISNNHTLNLSKKWLNYRVS